MYRAIMDRENVFENLKYAFYWSIRLESLRVNITFANERRLSSDTSFMFYPQNTNKMQLFNANSVAKCFAFVALLTFGLNAAAQDVKQADKKESCCKKDNKKCCKKDNKKCCKKEDKKSCKKGCMNDCKKECNEKKGCCGEQGCGDKKSCDKK